jgi:hypothetical protein
MGTIRQPGLASCAALRDDGSVQVRSVEPGRWHHRSVDCDRRWRGAWRAAMLGRKLLLTALLSSGVPLSMRHRGQAVQRCFFFLDVLDGFFFLMCVRQFTPSD